MEDRLEIVINDERINFTLEDETSLGQVISEIEAWLEVCHLIVTGIEVDGSSLSLEDRSQWVNTPLMNVHRITVQAQLLKELRLANLKTVQTYLALLARALRAGDDALFSELKPGFPYLLESLRNHFNPDPDEPLGRSLQELEMTGIPSDETIDEHIKVLQSCVNSRIDESRNPVKALLKFVEELKNSESDIGQVSLLLQTGKDEAAMAAVIRFSKLVSKVMYLLSRLPQQLPLTEMKVGGQAAPEFVKALNDVLKELIEAFTAKDSVLIGDLLEYEVAPRLRLLADFIGEIRGIKLTEP